METVIAFIYLLVFVIVIEIIFAKKRKNFLAHNIIIFPQKKQLKIKENMIKGNIYFFHSIFFLFALFGIVVRFQIPINNLESLLLVISLAMIICLLHLYNQVKVKIIFYLIFFALSLVFYLEEYLIQDYSTYILIAMNLLLVYITVKTYIPSRS